MYIKNNFKIWERLNKLGMVLLLGLFMLTTVNGLAMSQNETNVEQGLLVLNSEHRDLDENLMSIQFSGDALHEALEILAERLSVGFSYNPKILPDIKVSFVMSNVPAYKVIYKLLEGTNLEPVLPQSKDVIILREKKEVASKELIQETVTGTVIDAQTREALPGVNIVVQGTTIGTVTDIDGRFSLNVQSLNETLVISYIGYQTKEILLSGQSDLDIIRLETLVVEGQGMVITAFGIAREERSISYSTQGVNTDGMKQARELNVMQSLQGRVAGLSINSNSEGLGSEARVILRGNRSISGDSQPLYVIDGVPVRGNPSNLNPDNIASINVMKGPNAAALYGSAAQDGAIIIETYRGQAGEISISLNNSFMIRQAQNNYSLQNEYGQGSGGIYDRGSEFNWGPRMEGQIVDHWSPNPETIGQQYAFNPQPNNVNDFFKTGYNLSNSILASIGGERTQSVFSYTHTDARGVLPNNSMSRHNLSVRITSELATRLILDSKIDYMNQEIAGGNQSEGRFNPWRHILRVPRNISNDQLREFEYLTPEGDSRQNYFNPGSAIGANPYWIMNRTQRERDEERVIALTSLNYSLSDQLNFMVRASYDGSSGGFEERLHNDNYASAPLGRYAVGESNASVFNSEFLISYTEDLSTDWRVNGNFGGNLEKRRNSSVSTNTGDALLVPNYFNIANTNRPVSSHNQGSPVEIQSLYGFGQIGWRDAIYLDFSGRNDWSSTLPENSRSFFYPSLGVSAVVSDLVSGLPEFVTFARLRATWAETGSSAPPQLGVRTASFSAGGNRGFLQLNSVLPAESLRPERTKSFELGADLRFLNGRFNLDVTWYHTSTEDQLFTLQLPIGSGAAQLFTNGGDVRNKGVEVMLRVRPVQTLSINWNLGMNYAINHSMVERIDDERPRVVRAVGFLREFVIEEGRKYGELYSRGWLRDDQGRVIVSSDGLPRTTSGQSVYVGNFNPDWTASVVNDFSYRNINMSFVIEHRQGGIVASAGDATMASDGLLERTLQGREGGLIFGENIFPNETAVLDDGTPNTIQVDAESFWRHVGGRNQPVGEIFANDATNTRLREVTIGYTLPQSMLANIGAISSVRVSLVGRNLLFLYRATPSLDPDYMDSTGPTAEGSQGFSPPTIRSFGMNLNVNF